MDFPTRVHVKEKSWLAWLAAMYMRTNSIAIVWNNTIHLWGTHKNTFIEIHRWVKHELKHVEQFAHYGTFRFVLLYLVETIKKGYHNNRFEIEARMAEKE